MARRPRGPVDVGRGAVELGFDGTPWDLRGYALAQGANDELDSPFDRADAEVVVDTFRECSANWDLSMILSVTQGADRLSDTSAACVSDSDLISDEETRTVFIHELDLLEPADFPAGYEELIARGIEAYRQCVTPAEAAGLDFD